MTVPRQRRSATAAGLPAAPVSEEFLVAAAPAPPRAAVVVPVGPGQPDAFVDDTLASVRDHLGAAHTTIVVDDTGDPGRRWPADVVVVPAPEHAPGARGGLFLKLAAGIACAVELGGFDVLLRLDTDALVLRGGVIEAAAARFREDPGVGILGAVAVGPDGGMRSFAPAAALLRAETGPTGWRRPALRRVLVEALAAARSRDYVPGAHALGGAYLLSAECASSLVRSGWLGRDAFATSRLGEDHLMALVAAACGYRLGEFGRPGDPLALRWIGLPAHPRDVWASGAAVTHSVRSWSSSSLGDTSGEDLDEGEIRAWFAALRTGSLVSLRSRARM